MIKEIRRQGAELFREDKILFSCLFCYCVLFAGFFFLDTDMHRDVMYLGFPLGLAALVIHGRGLSADFYQNKESFILIAGFVLFLALSLLWSDVAEEGREFDKAKITLLLPFSLVTLYLITTRISFAYEWLVLAFVAGAFFTGIYLFAHQIPLGIEYRLKGLGRADNSVMGAYLYAIAFLAVLFAPPFVNLSWRYRIPVLLLLFIITFCTLSRGPLLALCTSLACIMVVKGHYKIVISVLLVAICAGLLVFYSGLYKDLPILNRKDTGRTQVWDQAIDRIKEEPFIGHGIGSKFHYKFITGKKIEIASHPHNLFLSTFVQGGIVGVLLLSCLIVAALGTAFKVAKGTGDYWPLAVLLSCCTLGLFDFGGLYVNLGVPWMAFWYPFILAVAMRARIPGQPAII